MSKTLQRSQSVVKPPLPEKPLVQTPDFTGYFSDIEVANLTALESLVFNNEPILAPAPACGPSSPPDTTVILKKDGVYHVYFHIDELSSSSGCMGNLDAFTQWVMSLNSEDIVYFYQTGCIRLVPNTIQALIVLDTQCLARTIFIIDHIIETPLFLFVCKEHVIESTGAVTFSNSIPDDSNKMNQMCLPYLRYLYTKAVRRGLLTEDEAKSIVDDNAIVFKTASNFRTAQKPVK